MARKTNPFKKIMLTPENRHAEVVIEITSGIFVRATFNLSKNTGWLSRGTIGIWDPATGRYKQRIQDGTHDFKNTMTKDLIVPEPQEGESQFEVIERTTRQAANELINTYRHLIVAAIRDNRDLHNLSLGQALDIYGPDYIADCSTSPEMKKTYRNQLQNLANFLGERSLKEIKRSDFIQFCRIHRGRNSHQYIATFQKFLSFTSFRLGIAQPCQSALDSFFRSVDKGKKNKQRDKDVATDILPKEYENRLDNGCWDHLGDPFWGITVMGKESGLDVKTLCGHKIEDIILGDENEVYVIHQRDDLASYTNDYSFPLGPFGASYISKYLAFLADTFPPERMEGDKYLFSKDTVGAVPLTTKEVTSFIRTDISRFLFGRTGRITLENGTSISMGLPLLRNTRKKHLLEDCRFDDDHCAILFLLHQSLTRYVQADNYRSFTDVFARRLLRKRLEQDQHGYRPPESSKKYTRMTNINRGDFRELHFPAKKNSCPGKDQMITITFEGLEPGDLIEVRSKEGCYVSFN